MNIKNIVTKYLLRYESIIWLASIIILLSWPQLFHNLFTQIGNPNSRFNFWFDDFGLLHISLDILLGFANLAITLFIALFVIRAGKDLPFPRLFLVFSLCTASNSAIHFMNVWSVSIYYPWLFGLIKLIAAVVNVIMVILLPIIGPRALALIKNATLLKSTKANLQTTNRALEGQILERMQAEEELIRTQNELELRVIERTAQLEKINKKLLEGIKEKNKAEAALKDSETLFRQLAENIRDVFFIMEPENQKINYLSPTYEQVWGHSLKSAYENPRSLFEHIHPDDKNNVNDILRVSKRSGVLTNSYRIIRPDGKIKWVRVRAFPILDENEKLNRIAGVAEDITISKQYEQRLESSLREKEILLKEIHHRVKNNLQIISSLLNLQSKFVTDQRTLEIFHEGRNRIKTMALIHEKLYGPKDFTRINFAEYLNELFSFLLSAYKFDSQKISYKIEIGNVYLDIDQALTLGLIVNELITNSIKYAFPNGLEGQLKISMSKNGNHNLLRVYDNGIGIPPEIDIGKTDTLGLQLVQMFVEQIGGTIELKRGKGTEYLIGFLN